MRWFWERLRSFFVSKIVADRLGQKPSIVIYREVGSLYSVELNRQRNAARLKAICDAVVTDKNFVMRDITGDGISETFCNRALWETAAEMGYPEIRNKKLSANQSIDAILADKRWRSDTGERAAEHARMGGLAIAGVKAKKHGHVATVYPAAMLFSGSLDKYVPVLANVGKRNGIMKASEAFPVADGEPEYFLFDIV